MTKKYDSIVVGSGIGGMTLALLLGMNGHSVLLLEKNPRIGGSMARFFRQGVPFDTGFHFTGGLYEDQDGNGVLYDMLTVLGIHEYIEPIYLRSEKNSRLVFERENAVYELPADIHNLPAKLKSYFPGEEPAIDRYFEMVEKVCRQTVAMDLRRISFLTERLDEDYTSLEEVLNRLTGNEMLKGIFSMYCMCYGVKPSEISFANHSRVAWGLYKAVARIKDGGDAFIRAFRKTSAKLDIEVKCGAYITECTEIRNKQVGRFVLNTGEPVSADACIFTIHPHSVLETLPKEHLHKAFVDRVNAFEPSAGFFSVYGVVDEDIPRDAFYPTVVSLFPSADINRLMDPSYIGDQALVVMRSLEGANNKSHRVLNAFELSFPEHVEQWRDSKPGQRSPEYREYKQRRVERIRERVVKAYPEYSRSYRILDAASVLTLRDYLNTPYGSAYGIKQKIGQFNLFGRLPLRNLYAAGQSSVLPGLVGAMMSSFIVGRIIIGKTDYHRFIEKRLDGLPLS